MKGSTSTLVHLRFIFNALRRHFYTCLLFTWTDYKTIMLPIVSRNVHFLCLGCLTNLSMPQTAFACASAPLRSAWSLVQGSLWIWLHLLMCNVSNQARSEVEDAINRPWRPLPSGRLTMTQAVGFRWSMVVICMLSSAVYGPDVLLATVVLVITTVVYDEGRLSDLPLSKNLCNIGGYTALEYGATKIMSKYDSRPSLAAQTHI